MTSFDNLLDQYRSLSDSERMKGSYFEQLVKQFLLTDGVHAPQYRNVWLWKDWPDRNGQADLGIDLVAEREDVAPLTRRARRSSELRRRHRPGVTAIRSRRP